MRQERENSLSILRFGDENTYIARMLSRWEQESRSDLTHDLLQRLPVEALLRQGGVATIFIVNRLIDGYLRSGSGSQCARVRHGLFDETIALRLGLRNFA